jgi:isoleucyl-tRNA synthetase
MEEEKKQKTNNEKELDIIEFWKRNNIFEKSLEKDSPKGEFVFYDGPPTANGRPGIHHLEARAFKDAIPRYKTMCGYHVRRKGGWDTHGLPVELQVEKELGLVSKKQIEEYGIDKFNQKCKESVWTYIDEWEKFTNRSGYWVDSKNPYVTYHSSYIESLWNVVKEVNNKNLLYKDYRIVPWCSRCGTALSSHELAQGYKDVKDLSVTAKFKVVGEDNTFILAWTTTPWTLPGNVALAVNENLSYVKVFTNGEYFILGKDRLSILEGEYSIQKEFLGSELVGIKYEPLYSFLKDKLNTLEDISLQKAFQVYSASFVTADDGTGIVHTAVMYGQDDFELGTKLGLPKYHLVNDDGTFKDDMDFLSSRFVKDEQVAIDIIKDLANRASGSLLFKKEKYEHSYPHCWRCSTPLIYYARDSWYIRMSQLRDTLVGNNDFINWEPEHVRQGRFGEWIKEVKDWAISRERYWGTPLPVWEDENGNRHIFTHRDELKNHTKKSGNNYVMIRHGEAESNVSKTCSYATGNTVKLTQKGIEQIKKSAEELKDKKIDLIYASPFLRTMESARIIADVLGLPHANIIQDPRLVDLNVGIFEGKTWEEYFDFFKDKNRFKEAVPGGENMMDVKRRTGEFLYDVDSTLNNKNILIVAHGCTLCMLESVAKGAT